MNVIAPVRDDFESAFKNGKRLPFAGSGLGGTSQDDSSVDLTATGGVDERVSNQLTANGSVL